jgi:hypothetical protein
MHGTVGGRIVGEGAFTPREKKQADGASFRAAVEGLEARQLLTAVVVAPTAAPAVGSTPLAPIPGKTFWVNGLGTADPWNLASAITPNTTNDLVLNVAPFATLYNPCCEGGDSAPGNTSQAGQLLTNGLLQNQIGAFPAGGAVPATGSGGISDPSHGVNVLSDLDDPTWWMAYNLGGQPGATPSLNGYDISEIDVITGHQDFRTGQNTDIMVQFASSPDWNSLSFGQNFNFTRDQNNATLDRGSAQMAIVNNGAGTIASNVRAIKFIAGNNNTWYRELVVTGTASAALPSAPSVPTNVATNLNSANPGNVDVAWKDGAAGASTAASEFLIQRAAVVNGVTGSFAPVATLVSRGLSATQTYTDISPAPGIYAYKVIAFNSASGGTFSGGAVGPTISVHVLPAVVSISRTTPAGPVIPGGSVAYTVTFNQSVTGVDATDFSLATTGNVTATTPVVVSGSGAVYTVTVNNVSGGGSLGLNLVDNGTIQDAGRTMTYAARQQSTGPGSHPRAVAVTDVSADGKRDLIVANFSGNSVAVMLGNGNGTFAPAQTLAVGIPHTYGMALVVQDVNGDGKPDILVAGGGENGVVSVLLGNGNGTFAVQKTFAAGPNTYALTAADVNGDGKPDIAVADNSLLNGSVGILLGNGNGTFAAMQTVSSGTYPQSIASGDVNGDGKQDLVVGMYSSNTVALLLGNGNGTFKFPANFGGGTGPSGVTIAEVSGDGKQDVLVTDAGSGNVGVLLGNGNGTFLGIRSSFAGARAFAMTVADVNADGKLDLTVASANPAGAVSVLLGNGNGVFQAAQSFAVGANPLSVAVGDITGDGKPDIVSANVDGDNVSILTENANMSSAGQVYTVLPLVNTINGSAVSDQITLTRDADNTHIDWSIGSTAGQLLINDAAGLTINGLGSNDAINLVYTNGSPLPNTIHLNGAFTINGLGASNPLVGTTLEIGQSTVYVFYGSGASPAATIQQYLTNGYNGGAWNGTSTVSSGVVTSTDAATGAANVFGVGFVDSADALIPGQPANTIELRFTVMGDANLDRIVDINDATRLQANFNAIGTPAWDRGNFNFDAVVDSTDAILMARNYGSTATGGARPAAAQITTAAATNAASTLVPTTSPGPTELQGDSATAKGGRRSKKRR